MLYSLADRTNWQGKFINLFVDVPDFKDTPLGMSVEWVHTAKSDFIKKFQSTLLALGRSEVEMKRYTDFLRRAASAATKSNGRRRYFCR